MTATTMKDAHVLDGLREVIDNVAVDRVFGTPVTQGDTVVLPVAKIGGGAGGGGGTGPAEQGQENGGAGGGVGMSAKPLGVFVLRDGTVHWRPAVDVTRIILGGQLVAVAALLVARALITARGAGTHQGARPRARYGLVSRAVPRRRV